MAAITYPYSNLSYFLWVKWVSDCQYTWTPKCSHGPVDKIAFVSSLTVIFTSYFLTSTENYYLILSIHILEYAIIPKVKFKIGIQNLNITLLLFQKLSLTHRVLSDAIWRHRAGSTLRPVMIVARWHQAITWTNVNFSVMRFLTFTWECPSKCFVQWTWKLYLWNYWHISQGKWVKRLYTRRKHCR